MELRDLQINYGINNKPVSISYFGDDKQQFNQMLEKCTTEEIIEMINQYKEHTIAGKLEEINNLFIEINNLFIETKIPEKLNKIIVFLNKILNKK